LDFHEIHEVEKYYREIRPYEFYGDIPVNKCALKIQYGSEHCAVTLLRQEKKRSNSFPKKEMKNMEI